MKKSNDIFNKIKELELSLLTYDIRNSIDELNELIEDEFIEIGSSGKIYNKQDTIHSLPDENERKFKTSNFKLTDLSNEMILVTYETEENLLSTLRSSIWKKSSGNWKIIFHQGTKKQNL